MRTSKLVVVSLACGILVAATLARAQTVTMNFISADDNNSGGYYTYPYYFTINSGTNVFSLMCDTFTRDITPIFRRCVAPSFRQRTVPRVDPLGRGRLSGTGRQTASGSRTGRRVVLPHVGGPSLRLPLESGDLRANPWPCSSSFRCFTAPWKRFSGDWDRMIDVNIKGVLYGIAAALPHMKQQKSGHIINVSSVAGHKVRAGGAVYAATKHAVRALSEGLRLEVKPYNIRTTVISPGAVATELPDSATEPDIAEGFHKFYKEIAIPAESFARAVVFAMSQPEDVDVNEILFRPTRQEL